MASTINSGMETFLMPETKRFSIKRLTAVMGKTAVWGAILTSPYTLPNGLEWFCQKIGFAGEFTQDFKQFVAAAIVGGLATTASSAYVLAGRPAHDPEKFISEPTQEMELVGSYPLQPRNSDAEKLDMLV